MSIEPNDPLEQSLKGLTWWPGPAPGLWKKALRQSGQQSASGGTGLLKRILRSPWPWVGTPIAAVLVAAVISTSVSPFQNNRWDSAYSLSVGEPANKCGISAGTVESESPSPPSADFLSSTGNQAEQARSQFKVLTEGRQYSLQPRQFICPSAQASISHTQPETADRHVIRKAAIDLQADDVRGVYLKIQALLPNQAAGEFVEASQIHDTGGQLNAYLTLRVRAERLSGVLDALRGLAVVIREQSDASDVTAQVVDIEARLRNERRVEQELLDLLEKRKDAALDDVLKLSNSLAEVRGRIERLTADQQNTVRQVALATVVVTIHKRAPEPVAAGTGLRLRERLASAWRDGLSFLIESFAAVVRVIVGGLIWWVLLVLMVWLVRRWYLRRAT